MITRRTLLKYGLSGSLVLAAGSVTLGLRGPRVRRPRPKTIRALSEREFHALEAIALGLCPGGDSLPDAAALDVVGKVDTLLTTMPAATRAEVKQVIALMDNALAATVLEGRTVPLSHLEGPALERALEGWRRSRLSVRRTAFKAVHKLCMSAYWSDPRVYAHCGYPGPPALGARAATARASEAAG